MEREARRRVLRREVLGLLGGALAVPAGRRASAAERDGWWLGLPSARELAGDAPSETGLLIDLPFLVEDGASVPLRVVVDRPMTPRSHVASLHCFALGNPIREIADCFFSPRSGRAEVATRIRLDDTQSVAAVAVTSDGEAIVARREIQVFITGCLINPATYATEHPMRTRARLYQPAAAGAPAEVVTMINHPMESGRRTDPWGAPVPRNMVERFHASFRGATVFEARFHPSMAANPYLRFFFVPEGEGELVLRWEEDTGRAAEERLAVGVG